VHLFLTLFLNCVNDKRKDREICAAYLFSWDVTLPSVSPCDLALRLTMNTSSTLLWKL